MADLIRQRSESELKQLALDIVEGRVFGSWMLESPADIRMVFMMLAFLDEIPPNAGHIFEYMDARSPRDCNGLPTFLSLRFIAREDSPILLGHLKALEERRKAFLQCN